MHRARKTTSPKQTLQQQLANAEACVDNPDKFQEGITLFQNVLQQINNKNDRASIGTKGVCLAQIAFIYYKQKDFANCAIYLERYNELYPNGISILQQLVVSYTYLNDLEKANKHLNKLKQKKSDVDLAPVYNELLKYFYTERTFNKIIPNAEKQKEMMEVAVKHGFPEAQISYDKFQIGKLTAENKFEEANSLALKYCKNEDIYFRLFALYTCGFCTYRLGKHIKMAIQFFEKYMAVYEENKNGLEPQDVANYSTVAHTLAKIYDGDKDSSFADSEKELKYLTISANLGYAKSHHDLGYIYEHGEDCAVDLDKAITHYSKAVELDHEISNLNLGIVLKTRNQDDDSERAVLCFERALQTPIPEIKMKTVMQLGLHYLNLSYTYDKPEEIQLKQTNEKIAFDFFMSAHEMECAQASCNIGYFYYYGLGVEKNFAKARDFFEIAETRGIKINDQNYASAYLALIQEENDLAARNTLTQAFTKRFGEETELLIEIYNQIRHQESIATNKQIIIAANDATLDIVNRINTILNFNLERMDTVNVCTLLHRLGNLVDKSLNHRDFHQKNLTLILPLIETAYERLLESRFQNTYYVTLVEGLSKLYLTLEIEIYKKILEALYKKAASEIDKLTPISICNLIFAATRLDPNLEIRAEVKCLIKKILADLKTVDDRSLANFIFAVIILSMKSTFELSMSDYQPLIKEASLALAKPLHFMSTKQICQALNYCYQNKKFRNSIDKATLDRISLQIENSSTEIIVSGLQREIIHYLSIFFPKISVEKMVNIYSVDALVEVNEKQKFILQADGPSHFLHGINTMRLNNRTLFRDEYLAHYHPVLSIPYNQWRTLKSFSAIKDYFAARLSVLNIELPSAPGPRRHESIYGFFNRKHVPKRAAPSLETTTPGLRN